MPREQKISIGQYSSPGRKAINQDFHGALIPERPARDLKGIAIALADGISSSKVSGVASESAVKAFLTDYYCTPASWSVKTSAQRVIAATNSWLHAQTRRGQTEIDMDKGYVCTLSVMVVKSTIAHIFHVGDSRVCRLSGGSLEQLTTDHRVVISSEQTYLSRALGVNREIEIDYAAVTVRTGDVFLLTTDGVHEYSSDRFAAHALQGPMDDLDAVARGIVEDAWNQGSPDNLTVQIVRIDELPDGDLMEELTDLPLPPLPEARQIFDGHRILRQIHASSRSHIYLAENTKSGEIVALKLPSIDLRDQPDYLRRFMMEEWVARRIDNAHVLKPGPSGLERNFLYTVTEFVEGQTLTQWMIDHPGPDLETVRGLVEQIAKGLRAFHRMEMIHQDLRPENIMIDKTGTVKIIDFGSTSVAGVVEARVASDHGEILGTAQYTAPEYFLGEPGTARSDIYSLGVITYQMLTGQLPYGAQVARIRTVLDRNRLRYRQVSGDGRTIPVWIDNVLRKAVHPDPNKRYGELSEYVYDLRHPSGISMTASFTPMIDRNPLLFWKTVSFLLLCVIILLAISR